jgi:CelD/BcsL family acetyltransferase involved in cellulose biosynthesis
MPRTCRTACAPISTDRTEILDAVDWFFQHKLQWLKDRRTSAPSFESAAFQSFLKATVVDMHDRGELVLGKLASAHDILSVGFGYTFRNVFIFQNYAYNAEFGVVSPSRLVLEQLIRWCLDHGIDEFDFLPWDIAYKAQWADTTLAIHDYVLPRSLIERLKCELQMVGIDRLAKYDWLTRQYQRLPARFRDGIRQIVVPDWDIGGVVQRLGKSGAALPRYNSGSPT